MRREHGRGQNPKRNKRARGEFICTDRTRTKRRARRPVGVTSEHAAEANMTESASYRHAERHITRTSIFAVAVVLALLQYAIRDRLGPLVEVLFVSLDALLPVERVLDSLADALHRKIAVKVLRKLTAADADNVEQHTWSVTSAVHLPDRAYPRAALPSATQRRRRRHRLQRTCSISSPISPAPPRQLLCAPLPRARPPHRWALTITPPTACSGIARALRDQLAGATSSQAGGRPLGCWAAAGRQQLCSFDPLPL
jgi:hypothetical protein